MSDTDGKVPLPDLEAAGIPPVDPRAFEPQSSDAPSHSAGYPGQIVVRADPALPAAAFVLDWGDGSAAFDPEESAARVAQALDEALAAEGFHAESLTSPNEADHG